MVEHTTMPTKTPQKKEMSGKRKKEKALVLKYVGRAHGVCLVASFCVQAGHLRTCLPQAAQSIDYSNS